MIKSTLLSLLLLNLISLISCAYTTPLPEITYYGAYFDIAKPGFYGVDKDGDKMYIPWSDETMHGAQCLRFEDYYKLQVYLERMREKELGQQ